MDVREKLVELIKEGIRKGLRARGDDRLDYSFEDVADYLISSGVTVQCDKGINVPTKWISVTERLPEKGEEVLVFDTRENWTGFACLRPDETWTALGFDFPFDLGEVTHWMPLPQPPKGE